MTLSAETISARRGVAGALDVVPTGAALGAEVRGIDLRNIEEGRHPFHLASHSQPKRPTC